MTLVLYTARVSYGGPDRIDVTRKGGSIFGPTWALLNAGRSGSWETYAEEYTRQMRQSWRRHRSTWLWLLGRQRAVLCCYCTDAERCHRTLLAGLLVKAGAARGIAAEYRGEISVARETAECYRKQS